MDLDFDPIHYLIYPEEFCNFSFMKMIERVRCDYQVVALLKKYPHFKSEALRPREVAITKAETAEARCALTNRLFRDTRKDAAMMPPFVHEAIHLMRIEILRIIGTEPDWELALRDAHFGDGATFALPRTEADVFHKFGDLMVTPECAPLADAFIRSNGVWDRYVAPLRTREGEWGEFTLVPGNKLDFVPKTAKTDRTIAVEPALNQFVQSGLGGVIRRRLRRYRTEMGDLMVNLNDQGWNQSLALTGSRDGTIATIDLASASDTVSTELVREVLPPDWFRFLDIARCRRTRSPDGTWNECEKFSSMGNGFTFELESLIFAATVAAVQRANGRVPFFGVFGDDIAMPTEDAERVVEVLSWLGFDTNVDKTFIDGAFRESCGCDYVFGQAVRPHFIKSEVRTLAQHFLVHNGLKRASSGNLRYAAATRWIRRRLPKVVTDTMMTSACAPSDGGLHTCLDSAVRSKKVTYDRAFGFWRMPNLVRVAVKQTWPEDADRALIAYLYKVRGGVPDSTTVRFNNQKVEIPLDDLETSTCEGVVESVPFYEGRVGGFATHPTRKYKVKTYESQDSWVDPYF